MGVTLERVQNKFACIIGELCSEPVILSQFAIWVDLRIAEYKAKGAISLECSGEDPDPVWLKGHKPAPPTVNRDTTPIHHHGRRMGDNSIQRPHSDSLSHPILSHLDQSEEVAARLSPDIVVIKEEPQEDESVFPVSLHRHDDSTVSRNTPRKRTSESVGPSDGSHSPSKLRKVSSSSSSPALHIEPVNQSLMSIISESALEESGDSSANFTLDYSSLDPSNEENAASLFQSQPVPSTSSGDSADQQDSSSTGHWAAFSGSPAGVVGEGMPRQPTDPSQEDMGSKRDHLYPCTYPARLHVSSIRARVPRVSSQTATKMVRAVATLERWLWSKYGETRRIETIPPPELDAYLAEFWQVLVRENGTDFLPVSFRKYRYCLDRFLVANDYPESITTSHAFPQSQSAYQFRVNLLILQGRS
ncbi:uncharacterized protein LOC135463292 isoform X2 [Liolophura sinensis]|uniref:uncharacterized protein LOC135463292 isoform X2 n=1 Tax=Liolophura sinensis TaxID=3198878 RepID=UPI0031596091